jgi:peptide deformylase
MATRIIRKYGDELLRKKSKLVSNFNDRLGILLTDMVQTMREAEGVGLAAPQVGVLRRVVVIDVGDGLIELVNPEIIYNEGENTAVEACLSVPGVMGEVVRPYRVKVKAQDRNGKPIKLDGEGFLARALCHEIDHLDGILFVDKVSKFIESNGEG